MADLTAALPRHDVDVVVDIPPGRHLVAAPPELVERAVGPVVDNAVRHASRQVRIAAVESENTIGITVTDDGPGVDPDHREAIFDAGYVAMGWPTEYGGRGADVMAQTIVNEELVRAGAPTLIGMMGINMGGHPVQRRRRRRGRLGAGPGPAGGRRGGRGRQARLDRGADDVRDPLPALVICDLG